MDYNIVKKIARDIFRVDSHTYPAAPILTIAHDNDRSLFHAGKYYSPLIDTIEDDLRARGIECVSVARIISAIKGELSYGRTFSADGGFARALVAKRVKQAIFRAAYPYSSLEQNVWGNILDSTGAKKVFGIQPSRELCVACHQRGVWVADVQHGVIADTHPWYGERFRAGDPVEWLPNAFLCWDFGSQKVIEKWAKAKAISTFVIGNRWLARFAARSSSDQLVEELFREYERRQATAKLHQKTILVSLSWGLADIPNGFITQGLMEAIKRTLNRFTWLIRLHPNQLKGFASDEGPKFRKFFCEQLSEKVEWEETTRAPLPVVLTRTDLHISWNSSVSIEAAQLGIPTALLDPKLRSANHWGDYFAYYRENGLIDLVKETEESILEWIGRNLESKHNPENYAFFNDEYEKLLSFLAS